MKPITLNHWMTELLVLLAVVLVMLIVTSAAGDTIRLHGEAVVDGDQITLGDIADLEGQHAQAMESIVIARFSDAGEQFTITLTGLRNTLKTHRVNWGLVNLKGFTTCTVFQGQANDDLADLARDETAATDPVVAQGLAGANLESTLSIQDPVTLLEKVTYAVQTHVGGDPTQLQIHFTDRDLKAMQAVGTGEFVFDPMTSPGTLGRVGMRVIRVTPQQHEPVCSVSPTVSRRMLAVVAARSVRKGQTITPHDVKIHEIELTHNAQQPLTETESVIGQVAGTTWRQGDVVYERNLQSPVVVKRGDLITVQCVVGGLLIKTTARANEAGGVGETITVRNLGSREIYTVKITGNKQAIAAETTAKQLARSAS